MLFGAVLTTGFVEVAVGDETGAAEEAVDEAKNLLLRSRVDNEAFVLLLLLLLIGVVSGDVDDDDELLLDDDERPLLLTD